MSRTVSFRASEELDEFLEREAKRRMTTKSTVSQMLLAERVRQLKEERGEETESSEETSQEDDSGQSLPEEFHEHIDKWYRPDGENDFAVRMPGDEKPRYYNTQEGAAERLRKEYGG